jgi:hypothetical protein
VGELDRVAKRRIVGAAGWGAFVGFALGLALAAIVADFVGYYSASYIGELCGLTPADAYEWVRRGGTYLMWPMFPLLLGMALGLTAYVRERRRPAEVEL